MKLILKHIIMFTFLILLVLSASTYTNNSSKVKLIENQKSYIAGSAIELKFKSTFKNPPLLFCSNSYSNTLIEPEKNDANELIFIIPEYISNKSGLVNWKVIAENETILNGDFEIIPDNKNTYIESYFGPRSILAGGNDHSMLVIAPTDYYDNPVIDSTQVVIKHQFLNKIDTTNHFTKNLMVWKNIFSYEKSGRILVSSMCNNIDSKELATAVYPNMPQDFTIEEKRIHHFADGNQIASLITSKITDAYNNPVIDGTHVEFFVKDSSNSILKTNGQTINGIAIAKMLHPDHSDYWNVKAYIPGMAESNEISLEFDSVMNNYDVVFLNENRQIKVGPLKSFMNQLLPDGFIVKLSIIYNKQLLELKIDTSNEGYVTFDLPNDFYKAGNYDFIIESGGIKKEFLNIKLDVKKTK